MKRMLIAALALTAVAGSTMPAFADGSGAVSARVTVASPCITVDPPSIDFGSAPFRASNGDLNDYISRPVTIGTCGMVETLLTRGSQAVAAGGPAVSWNLGLQGSVCPSVNVYGEAFGYQTNPLAGTSWRPLTTSDQFAFGDAGNSRIGPEPSAGLSLGLRMPCVGSDGASQVMNFSYTFTAVL
jgi:hypothetical protein